MEFVVCIERTERYLHKVIVKADNEREACRKVQQYDDDNAFENEWNELDPDVDTEYYATPMELACLSDHEKDCIKEMT